MEEGSILWGSKDTKYGQVNKGWLGIQSRPVPQSRVAQRPRLLDKRRLGYHDGAVRGMQLKATGEIVASHGARATETLALPPAHL